MTTKLTIVIVNWNTGKLLAQCIESIAACSDKEMVKEIVVIDNNSSDRSIVIAQSSVGQLGNKPPVRFVINESNLGFARGCNVGIDRWQKGGQGGHLLLLNPDTVVADGALTKLVKGLDNDERVGILGPRLLNEDGSLQKSVRTFPNFWVLSSFVLKITKLVSKFKFWRDYMMTDFDYTRRQRVDQVMGACFLIRDKVIDSVGQLNEKYWIWFEEVDYCKRALKAGWQTVYDPEPTITHLGGISFGRAKKIRKTMAWLMSIVVYSKEHLPIWQNVIIWVLIPVGFLEAVLISWLSYKND
jgi:hypothetical protein